MVTQLVDFIIKIVINHFLTKGIASFIIKAVGNSLNPRLDRGNPRFCEKIQYNSV